MKRKSISKGRRFAIFQRDKFACRYCGQTSETVMLEVDHVIPVARGGSSEDDNLITSCYACNRGKGAKPLDAEAPTESDALRIKQERQEIMAAARLAKKAAQAQKAFAQEICNFWCEVGGQSNMDKRTLATMCSFAKQHGVELVFEWIQIAAHRLPGSNDQRKGAYVGGIRKKLIEEGSL